MVDVHTKEQRSRNMAAIRLKDTKPEMAIRRLVHSLGFRYRLNVKDLPGKPDLVFPKLRKVIFVHGCYWHKHYCRYGRVTPKTNASFWKLKRNDNVHRDKLVRRNLRAIGWNSLTVWECKTKNLQLVQKQIELFLR